MAPAACGNGPQTCQPFVAPISIDGKEGKTNRAWSREQFPEYVETALAIIKVEFARSRRGTAGIGVSVPGGADRGGLEGWGGFVGGRWAGEVVFTRWASGIRGFSLLPRTRCGPTRLEPAA